MRFLRFGGRSFCHAAAPVKRLAILTLTGSLAAGSCLAQDITPLFEAGLWGVNHLAYDDGTSACSMESTTPTTSVAIVAFSNISGLTFAVQNSAWAAPPRAVKVFVKIDGETFNGDANVNGDLLTVENLLPEFITAVGNGSALRLYSATGAELLAYSLEGSAAAFGALADCWGKIAPSDPFGAAAADPF